MVLSEGLKLIFHSVRVHVLLQYIQILMAESDALPLHYLLCCKAADMQWLELQVHLLSIILDPFLSRLPFNEGLQHCNYARTPSVVIINFCNCQSGGPFDYKKKSLPLSHSIVAMKT